MNIPNMLTVSRLLVLLLIVGAYYLPYKWSHLLAAGLFAVASITDWLDGYLARKLEQMTALGAFLDPVADKLMVCTVLVLLIEQHHTWWFTLPAILLISREIIISALREWMAELGQRTSVAVSWVGKVKTTFQMIAIFLLLLAGTANPKLHTLGMVLLYVAVVLSLWSMVNYLSAARKSFAEAT